MRTRSVLALVVLASVFWAVPAGAGDVVRLDSGWRFVKGDPAGAQAATFDASGWETVSVPHSWNVADWQGPTYYRGPGWYRRQLDVPASWQGKRVFVRFDAASIAAEVFVNGERVGDHVGAFAAFCFEITRQVRPGAANVLAVRVNNAPRDDTPPLSGDFNMFGGLYRPVTLFARDPICITPLDFGGPGVAVRQVSVSREVAEIEVVTRVADASGKPVASAQRSVPLPAGGDAAAMQSVRLVKPHLWNGLRDPYLHSVTVELRSGGRVIDAVTQPLGLRSYRFDPAQGFFLNGAPYRLHGVNRHQDREGKAWAISEKDQDEDMALVRELGANVIRLAHYQHSDYFYGLCDREGVIAWAEIPLVNAVRATEAFAANTKQQLTELIRQNINHPSIVMWSLYNEVGLRKTDDPVPLIKALHALARTEDPTRPTVGATSTGEFARYHEMVATPELLAGNLYPGWYSGAVTDMGPWIDERNAAYGNRGMGISEYGAGASIVQHEQGMTRQPEPTGKWHPEEWQAILHETQYAAIVARPFIWGSFVWNMFDFSIASRTEGDRNGMNDKGLVTYDRRTRKDAFFFYKANWNPEPMVYITSRRHVERTQPTTDVKVYSNCARAEMKVNGKSYGPATGNEVHVFVWKNVNLAAGDNTIEVEGQCGTTTVKDACRWVFKPTSE